MAEVNIPKTAYEVQYRCDECDQANMVSDREADIVLPFHYKCPLCNYKIASPELYPRIIYL